MTCRFFQLVGESRHSPGCRCMRPGRHSLWPFWMVLSLTSHTFFTCMHWPIYTLFYTHSWVTFHIALRFFSMQLSHFQYSVLPRIPSLESVLYLFNSGSPLDSFGVTSFLCYRLEAFSIWEAIAMVGSIYSPPSLREDYPLSTTLKTVISYILSFLEERGFQERDKSGPCYSISARIKTPFCVIANLKNFSILLRNTLVYTCKR